VRDCLAKQYWLAQEHGEGATFRRLHTNFDLGTDGQPKSTARIAQQLARIEADTDRIP